MEPVLQSILINTYNPDNQLRSQAEEQLNHFLLTSGAFITLLNYVGNVNNHRDLRQATSILIKNKMRDFWSDDRPAYMLTLDEKESVKSMLISILLVEMDNSIRGLLAESIRIVSEADFPDRWPSFIPTILENIQSNEVLRMYNSLLALRKVAKRYEYKKKEERKPLNDLVQASFPCLQQLLGAVLSYNTIEAAQVLKMCLKIFYSCTNFSLPEVEGIDVCFWFDKIAQILGKALPEASEGLEPADQPLTKEERTAWPWWKLKKWATRIISHFIQRYGNPRYASKEYRDFANYFRSNTAVTLLAPVMNILANRAKGSFVTDDVHRMCLGYVNSCVEMSPTYKVLKPHLQFILMSIVFPTLCLTDEDLRLFEQDPVEFIRKVHDPLGDWLSPLIAATSLLQTLARYRQKDTLPVLLPFIQRVLMEYIHTPPENRNYRDKDGALVAVAVIAKILLDSKSYAGILHPFLESHVIPEYECPIAFIRSRACWVIEYFSELDWSYQSGAHLHAVLRGLINGLRDPALPVQAAAACSLRLIISADGATDLVRPMLPDIVGQYFRIMEDVENESVLTALQAIILKFGEDIADLSPLIVTKLIVLFQQYLSAGEDDEEAVFNAVQCLETIDAVLEAVQDHPEVLAQLEPITQPMILNLLQEGESLYEYIDSATQMVSGYTTFSEGISPTMWSLCGPLLQVLNDWAIDYISEIMTPVLNYISKDIATFLQGSHMGKSFVDIILSVAEKVFDSSDSAYSKDASCAATMLSWLVSGSHGNSALKSRLMKILALTLVKLKATKTKTLKIRLLEVIMACLYYDAEATLSILLSDPSSSVASDLFNLLFDSLKDMARDYSMRLVVLSFTAVLSVRPELLPEFLGNNFHAMFQQIIRELVLIQMEATRERNDFESADDDDFDEDDFDDDDDDDDDGDDKENGGDGGNDNAEDFDDRDRKQAARNRAKKLYLPEGGYDEDEDCLNAEDEAYREALEKMGKDDEFKSIKYSGGDVLSEEDEEENYIFTSPIENMNMIQHFLDAMKTIELRDGGGALTASLQNGLNEQDKARLQELVSTAQIQQLLLTSANTNNNNS